MGEVRTDGDEAAMSSIYGAEHLLRLFGASLRSICSRACVDHRVRTVNLPELIAHTTMDAEGVAVLQEAIADMLKYETCSNVKQ